MSYFNEAFDTTMIHEGGYVYDPDDSGGETYKGISRKYNPLWDGWLIIDNKKISPRWPDCLDYDELLQIEMKKFYKERYFDPYMGDEMPGGLAIEMFDTSVNMGIGRAIKFIQIALNILNRNGKLYPDMVEDGDYGPMTHRCLQTYLKNDTLNLLLKILNVLQGNHYIEYMKKSPKQEKYARGWFSRVNISKQ